jgi:Ca-activated chloride channel family protein
MTFIWPIMLIFLISVPLLVGYYLIQQRRRRSASQAFGSMGIVQSAAQLNPGVRRHIPSIFFLAGLTLLIIALGRPETVMSLPKIEGTILLTFDVSGSMAADDLKPTRMDAAKAAARDFVERQPRSVLIGVIAFSDSGYSIQPPTNDKDTILASIDRLAPQRGTSLAHGIEASLNLLNPAKRTTFEFSSRVLTPEPTPQPVPAGSNSSAAIILLTDGENNAPPDPLKAAQAAADRGVRIYTVGIGSAAGANLHIDGYTVHSQLDEATLQEIAQITQGAYFNAADNQQLQKIYSSINPQLTVAAQKTEITAILSIASVLIFIVGAAISFLWFGRLA